MIVCLCHAVSDRTIKSVIEDGASTVQEVSEGCLAGTGCGACRATIRDLIDKQDSDSPEREACGHRSLPLLPVSCKALLRSSRSSTTS